MLLVISLIGILKFIITHHSQYSCSPWHLSVHISFLFDWMQASQCVTNYSKLNINFIFYNEELQNAKTNLYIRGRSGREIKGHQSRAYALMVLSDCHRRLQELFWQNLRKFAAEHTSPRLDLHTPHSVMKLPTQHLRQVLARTSVIITLSSLTQNTLAIEAKRPCVKNRSYILFCPRNNCTVLLKKTQYIMHTKEQISHRSQWSPSSATYDFLCKATLMFIVCTHQQPDDFHQQSTKYIKFGFKSIC